ncbi:MAG TPA: Ig-like domain-containing protein [Gemmatimonadaceae bacterium]|nr:Ig-like domain-containing protein [Gemmatimonadaceae bacterium]
MRKLGFLTMMLLGAACKGTDSVDPPVTTTVVVSSSAATIGVNETAQASAIVKDQNGNPLAGKTVSWTSLNPGIATVNPTTGQIRGVAGGTATIQGSVDGVTGSATITVVAPIASCVSGPTTADLATGQVRVMGAVETKGCIKIASTAAGSQYIVIGAYTSSTSDAFLSYTLKSDEGETVPSTSMLTTGMRAAAQLPLNQPELASSLQVSFESQLRQIERTQLDLKAGHRAYQTRAMTGPGRFSVNTAIPAVGDKAKFNVPKSCSNFIPVNATVRYISNRAIIYTDDADPAGGFSDAELQEIGAEFDNLIYPTDVDYFGTPLDLDNNGRINILFTVEVNKLTPAGSTGFVGGFFFAGDLFPNSGAGSCAQSNISEIFYALAPDPDGVINGNKRSTSTVRQGTRGTIAHEFQHMINASERIRSPIEQDLENVWLDEALAHMAEDLNGLAAKGLSQTGNYKSTDILPNGSASGSPAVNDYNAFFFQNFARFQRWLQNPGQNSPTSFAAGGPPADSVLAARGASWALLRYTADHYAPGGDIKAFTRKLAGGPLTGVNNLVTRAGGVPFDTLIAGWLVANYADDAGIPGLATKYTYKTYDIRSQVSRITQNQAYPLVVQDLSGSGVVVTGMLARSGSGNYFRFTRAAAGPARSFRFLNPDGATAVNFASASLIVLRSQ